MTVTSITCPGCRSTLKSATPIPAGRKIKCPKCNNLFAAGAPKPADKANGAAVTPARAATSTAIQEKTKSVPTKASTSAANGAAPAVENKAAKPPIEIIPFAGDKLPGIDSIGLKDVEDEKEAEDGGWEVVDEDLPTATIEDDDDNHGPKKSATKARSRRAEREEDEDEDEADSPRSRTKAARKGRVRDDDDDDDLDDEEEERPRRKQFKKVKHGSGKTLVLVYALILGFIFLAMAGGGGAVVYWFVVKDPNKGTGNEEPLAYIPADSLAIIGADLSVPSGGGTVSAYIEGLKREYLPSEFMDNVKKETGIAVTDLCQRFLVVIGKGTSSTPTTTVILQSNVPFKQRQIKSAASQGREAKDLKTEKQNGKTYYKVNLGSMKTLYMPSNRILILSNVPDDKLSAIVGSDGATIALSPAILTTIQNVEKNQLWLVEPFSDEAHNAIENWHERATEASVKPLLKELTKAHGFAVGLAASGNQTNLSFEIICPDSASAKKTEKNLSSLWNEWMKGIKSAWMLPLPKTLTTPLREIIKSATFSTNGNAARLTAKVTSRALDGAVAQLENLVTPKMMMGFAGGGAGGGMPMPGRPGR